MDECAFERGGLKVQTHPADHAIAVATAQTRLHARDALVRHACKAETSESAEMRKSEIESTRLTLHKTDVKAHFVPLDDLRGTVFVSKRAHGSSSRAERAPCP